MLNRSSVLNACEQEPLHQSGSIQGHGTLLALGPNGLVSHVAANVGFFLGGAPSDWLGRTLPSHWVGWLPKRAPGLVRRQALVGALEGPQGVLDVVVQGAADGAMVLEFTPSKRVAGAAAWAHKELLHDPVTSEHGDQLARERLLEAVQKGTGADRVLFYRFCADGDGEVVTETVSAEEEGRYLGLRFPASDIPQIARNLYRLNPWRLISDARSEPTPLLSGGFAPPDLSRSDLRSVSPVHRVYMGNMGVVGSLSFPVVVRDSLVALVTAHSRVVLLPQLETLEQLSAQVQAYNLAYTAFQAQYRMRMVDNLARRFEPVLWTLRRHGDVHAAWPELAPDLMTEFGADGAVVVSSQGCTVAGQGVEPAALAALDSWFESGTEVVWLGNNLVRQVPHFPHSETAGAIALRVVNRAAQAYRVYLTRRQHVHEVSWGGNPHKPVDYHDGVLGIKPRLSFEKWVEKRMGYALAWRNEDRLLGFKLRDLMQQAVTL